MAKIGSLTFEAPDADRFPAVRLAHRALAAGGSAPAVLNAANEVAVEAFLDGQIGFLDIADTVARCLDAAEARGLVREPATLTDVLEVDAEARRLARSLMGRAAAAQT